MNATVFLMGHTMVIGDVEPSDVIGGGIKVTAVDGVVHHYGPGAVFEVKPEHTPLIGPDAEVRDLLSTAVDVLNDVQRPYAAGHGAPNVIRRARALLDKAKRAGFEPADIPF